MAKKLLMGFDGVLYRGEYNPPRPWRLKGEADMAAIQAVFDYMEFFEIYIYSPRSSSFLGRLAMRRWLRKQFAKYYRSSEYPYTILMIKDSPFWDSNTWAKRTLDNLHFPKDKPEADHRIITPPKEWKSMEELATPLGYTVPSWRTL